MEMCMERLRQGYVRGIMRGIMQEDCALFDLALLEGQLSEAYAHDGQLFFDDLEFMFRSVFKVHGADIFGSADWIAIVQAWAVLFKETFPVPSNVIRQKRKRVHDFFTRGIIPTQIHQLLRSNDEIKRHPTTGQVMLDLNYISDLFLYKLDHLIK